MLYRNAREVILSQIEIYNTVKENYGKEVYSEKKKEMHDMLKSLIEVSKNIVLNHSDGATTNFWTFVLQVENFNLGRYFKHNPTRLC